jgi:hypothetical protein
LIEIESGSVGGTGDNTMTWAKTYVSWCQNNGFCSAAVSYTDLIDPENFSNPELSPFFDPVHYLWHQGLSGYQRINAYRHYFTDGWKAFPLLSKLVDPVVLQQGAIASTKQIPALLEIVDALSKNPAITTHALFDPVFYARNAPSSEQGMIAFLRLPVTAPFSPYVDVDFMNEALEPWNTRSRNALLCYLGAPVGIDVNPSFFSKWYADEYARHFDGVLDVRDKLSDYILIGRTRGFFPNPFMRRDFIDGSKSGDSIEPAVLLEAIKVRKYFYKLETK